MEQEAVKEVEAVVEVAVVWRRRRRWLRRVAAEEETEEEEEIERYVELGWTILETRARDQVCLAL